MTQDPPQGKILCPLPRAVREIIAKQKRPRIRIHNTGEYRRRRNAKQWHIGDIRIQKEDHKHHAVHDRIGNVLHQIPQKRVSTYSQIMTYTSHRCGASTGGPMKNRCSISPHCDGASRPIPSLAQTYRL